MAAQPLYPTQVPRVAGFSPDQLRAFEATRGLFETGMQFDPLTDIRGIAEIVPSLLSTDISAYQTPFQQQVIDQTMADIQDRLILQRFHKTKRLARCFRWFTISYLRSRIKDHISSKWLELLLVLDKQDLNKHKTAEADIAGNEAENFKLVY